MKAVIALALSLAPFSSFSDDPEIRRSVLQRDQQSAEFAARVRGVDTSALEQLHARQLIEAARALQPELRDYQRQKMADERALVLPAPAKLMKMPEAPLPLPGGPQPGVDPIPAQSFGH